MSTSPKTQNKAHDSSKGIPSTPDTNAQQHPSPPIQPNPAPPTPDVIIKRRKTPAVYKPAKILFTALSSLSKSQPAPTADGKAIESGTFMASSSIPDSNTPSITSNSDSLAPSYFIVNSTSKMDILDEINNMIREECDILSWGENDYDESQYFDDNYHKNEIALDYYEQTFKVCQAIKDFNNDDRSLLCDIYPEEFTRNLLNIYSDNSILTPYILKAELAKTSIDAIVQASPPYRLLFHRKTQKLHQQ